MVYEVEFRPAAARDLRKLDRQGRRRVLAAVELLCENPQPPKADRLQGQWRDYWRVHTGDYGIIYTIEQERLVICVVKIGRRKDVYRKP